MNDQTIPAEKVREVIEHFERKRVEVDNLEAINLLRNLKKELLPVQQPTTGLLGRWAKHPEHGDVVCVWDEPMEGHITVHYGYKDERTGTLYDQVPFDSLTFPHQAMKPADVPEDQPWLVDVEATHVFESGMVGIRCEDGLWSVLYANGDHDLCSDKDITLISPLAPERPVSDLQVKSTERALDRVKAKYDELESKYREVQERIKSLEQATPRTVTTKAEYEALPIGSMLVDADDEVWKKGFSGEWIHTLTVERLTDSEISGTTRTVLRYGWGDEQPAWRIEAHNPDNFRVGEYIIDIDGDSGTVTPEWIELWDTDEDTFGARRFAPFIVFPSKDAATPEAIAEAKRALDKEMDK